MRQLFDRNNNPKYTTLCGVDFSHTSRHPTSASEFNVLLYLEKEEKKRKKRKVTVISGIIYLVVVSQMGWMIIL